MTSSSDLMLCTLKWSPRKGKKQKLSRRTKSSFDAWKWRQTKTNRSNKTKLQVLKTAVHSYKSEMERYLAQKQSDDEKAAKSAKKLAEKEQELEREKQHCSTLEATIEGAKSSETSLLQQVKEIAQRERSAYERIDSLMKNEMELKGQITELQQEVENSQYKQLKASSLRKDELNFSAALEHKRALEAEICKQKELIMARSELKQYSKQDGKKIKELTTALAKIEQTVERGANKIAELEMRNASASEEHKKAFEAEATKCRELALALDEVKQVGERDGKKKRELVGTIDELKEEGEMYRKKNRELSVRPQPFVAAAAAPPPPRRPAVPSDNSNCCTIG